MTSSVVDDEHATDKTIATTTDPPPVCPSYNEIAHIPKNLRIEVIYHDPHIVVINKPSNLRSVPGNAKPPPNNARRKRPREEQGNNTNVPITTNNESRESPPRRRTPQQAWVEAIQSFAARPNNSTLQAVTESKTIVQTSANLAAPSDEIGQSLVQLGASDSLAASVPRKYKTFYRYLNRNQQRIWPSISSSTTNSTRNNVDPALAKAMFRCIEERQLPLLDRPEPTRLEESAVGQLKILGYADKSDSRCSARQLFVVHRLDCATSGIMVFARTEEAASFLCQAWRRESEDQQEVSKVYLAKVHDWPPWQGDMQLSGRIDLPLAPSEERLKWRVCKENDHKAKRSSTLWKVLPNRSKVGDAATDANNNAPASSTSAASVSTTLELKPLTGRTHQLRIHCAALCQGMVGDSLYGRSAVDMASPEWSRQRLHLHAYRLSFPHPDSKEIVTFFKDPWW